MSIYQLPEINFKQLQAPEKDKKPILNHILIGVVILLAVGIFVGFAFGYSLPQNKTNNFVSQSNFANSASQTESAPVVKYEPQTTQEQKIIQAVKEASPSVVSIVISKDVPVYQYQYPYIDPLDPFWGFFYSPERVQTGTQKQEVGAGTGFIVSEDGLIITNKHVASDEKAEYTITDIDGNEYTAKIVAVDPVQDLAIIKIQGGGRFKPIKLGDSSTVQVGQTAIAIGNALGQFQNTVSVGVISGLGRTVVAAGGLEGTIEVLEDIIQTDAAINQGNSGGPLLNLNGEVIGINTAVAENGQGIGFAIAINKAKRDIEQARTTGKITYPFLGVRYIIINNQIQKDKNLPVNYGALIQKGERVNEPAVIPGSPAAAAGLRDGDIILEFNGTKITRNYTLSKIIADYAPGQTVTLKILRNGKEMTVKATLSERNE
ncbi:MAG TPA: trypsin-like peptidase domain-containing protein [Candidatus Pacearchaeota archaeon]|nr:trypsin-like peptidase domain-containing protein [Candidatus Pacearchaeota archaeon]HRR94698.1 trypsin-like peptidase domain-containing protein [Candidatus Paceibacterota bacterium]HPC30378.1 trypsin-like peptidase domain-containing protein [Candidatus Pacearchaeota archaeon]HQG09191.1 trypsin-like peptidase domain-containing protein [Candidatus Pacearchaeota archaeon]HQH20247.1 trypsin-like peptidase domain-containing protein [Candidatus Pacearchaeota archaeon]